jgi:hypothetical protein
MASAMTRTGSGVTIRQSLSSGRAGLVRWSGFAFLVPGAVCLGFALRCLGDSLNRTLQETGDCATALIGAILTTDSILGFFGLIGLVAGVFLVKRAVGARRQLPAPASDIVIEQDGFVVKGGTLHGFGAKWSDIDPGSLRLDIPDWLENRSAGIGTPIDGDPGTKSAAFARLRVETRDGRAVVLCSTRSIEDLDSLRAVHDLFRNRLHPPSEPSLPPEVLLCGNCGAPVVPALEETAVCSHCGRLVPVPREVRDRVESAAATGFPIHLEEFVTKIPVLPDALRVNGIARRLLVFVAATGVSMIAILLVFLVSAAPDMPSFGLLVIGSVLIVTGASAIGRRYVVDRLIFELMGRHFGARPPASGGTAWTCPACGGPLPEGGSPLRRCVYCGACSVVGINAGLLATQSIEKRLVEEELEARFLERRKTITRARVALASMPLCLGGVILSGALAVETCREQRSCADGDGRACYEISHRLYSRQPSVLSVQSRSRSMTYAKRSCDAGNGCGCDKLRKMAEGSITALRAFGTGGGSDPQARCRELDGLVQYALTRPTGESGECHDER